MEAVRNMAVDCSCCAGSSRNRYAVSWAIGQHEEFESTSKTKKGKWKKKRTQKLVEAVKVWQESLGAIYLLVTVEQVASSRWVRSLDPANKGKWERRRGRKLVER
jgi:hypothetical protein